MLSPYGDPTITRKEVSSKSVQQSSQTQSLAHNHLKDTRIH
jgi:hypothetical protein